MAQEDVTPSGDETDRVDELPQALPRSATTDLSTARSHRKRHSKKLSLNFPVLVQPSFEPPLPGSRSTSPGSIIQPGTPLSARPLPSPTHMPSNSGEAPDFLEMIAGQERRCMELKEEWQKAETELMKLKQQWAVFEAKKKRQEIHSKTHKMGPISPHTTNTIAVDEEAERIKRRETREKIMRDMVTKDIGVSHLDSSNGRRNGSRVFTGKHTRALSLLQINSLAAEAQKTAGRSKSQTESSPSSIRQLDVTSPTIIPSTEQESPKATPTRTPKPSLTRQPTLQELISTSAAGAAQLNFGKTYKDLSAASRKSMPPGTDQFVKQGKQVYDGVSQGFWNFVEDIRQATVGDEPVNGHIPEPRREVRHTKSGKKVAAAECDRHGKRVIKTKSSTGTPGDEHKGEKDNFWKEFGLETPQSKQAKDKISTGLSREGQESANDHEPKLSTDSKCPPSLLADVMDVPEDDDAWDTWLADSPAARRHVHGPVVIRNTSDDDDEQDANSETPHVETGRHFESHQHKPAVDTSWTELTA